MGQVAGLQPPATLASALVTPAAPVTPVPPPAGAIGGRHLLIFHHLKMISRIFYQSLQSYYSCTVCTMSADAMLATLSYGLGIRGRRGR